MSESTVRVSVQGGSALTRDVFSHVMAFAGFEVLPELTAPTDTDIVVVVTDSESPTKILTESAVKRAIVVSDIDADDEVVADLVLSGAEAIVNLQATAQELADVMRTVANGGSVIAPRAARRISDLARASVAAASPDRPPLTNREVDILQCIGRGESVKETAATLGITPKTVENLQSRLFRKLEVRNRAQAYAQAHALGLLPTAQAE